MGINRRPAGHDLEVGRLGNDLLSGGAAQCTFRPAGSGELDGASPVQKFLRITWPLISPTTLFLFVVQLVSALQAYDQINVLTQGGPSGSTRTLLYLYYQSAFESFQIGEASSVAVVLVLICMLLSVLSFGISKRTTHYQ